MLGKTLAVFVAGLAVGVGVSRWSAQPPQHEQPHQQHQQQPVVSVPQREQQPAPPARQSQDAPRTRPRILDFGHPGPISDFFLRDALAVSYNRATRNAHWAAEHLTLESLRREGGDGDEAPDRANSKFVEEKSLPIMFRSRLADYVGTGFDRGHLVPAADVRESQKAVDETFMLSNISPQVAKGFNRGYWAHFENFVRSLTKQFDDVYVITGPLFLPQREENGEYWVKYRVLGNPPNTAVPTHFFKGMSAACRLVWCLICVIVAVKGGRKYSETFVLPNAVIEDTPLTEFITPVDAVERGSGLTLFPDLDVRSLPSLCAKTKCAVLPFRQAAKSLA
ncbi:nuclease [Polyrhizophydium stewartii]|uniref:Endonuclease n=1 Tax=Polyrhizophydium stewartii TaxID=2732419 RepID=A0ABR4MZA1_9FUNG